MPKKYPCPSMNKEISTSNRKTSSKQLHRQLSIKTNAKLLVRQRQEKKQRLKKLRLLLLAKQKSGEEQK
jgi:hypothetical protein